MEDLSHLVSPGTALTGGSSMNATNMVSNRPASLMSAPGSASILPPGIVKDTPDFEIPPVKDYAPRVGANGKKAGD